MLFVKIEDSSKVVELLVFPRLYKETTDLWQEGRAVIVEGKVSEKDQETKFLVNRALILDPAAPQKSVDDFKRLLLEGGPPKKNYRRAYNNNQASPTKKETKSAPEVAPVAPLLKPINPLRIIFLTEITPAIQQDLQKVLGLYPGPNEVYIRLMLDGKNKVIKTAWRVNNVSELRAELQKKFSKFIRVAEQA